MRHLLTIILVLCTAVMLRAQYPYYTNFNTNDGLPSNKIYNIIEDRYGFIWISTDQGVSRYDGVTFTNYTAKDGLSDNEVLNLNEDGKGRIWFNSFSTEPCYYWKGKIYNAGNDTFLKRISMYKPPGFMTIIVQYNNSMAFLITEKGRQLIVGKDIEDIEVKSDRWLWGSMHQTVLYYMNGRHYLYTFTYMFNWKPGDPVRFSYYPKLHMHQATVPGNELFGLDAKTHQIWKISGGQSASPFLKVSPEYKDLFSGVGWHILSGDSLYAVYDQTMGILKEKVKLPFAIERVYIDRKGNKWFGSFDNGIYMIRQYAPVKLPLPAGKEKGILSVQPYGNQLFLRTEKNGLLSIDVTGHCKIIGPSIGLGRIRGFMSMGNFHLLGTDDDVFRISKDFTTFTVLPDIRRSVKDMEPGPGTSILIATSATSVLYRNDSAMIIRRERTNAICMADNTTVWLGEVDGLKKASWAKDHYMVSRLILHPELDKSRIVDIKRDHQGNMWVATNQRGLFYCPVKGNVVHFSETGADGHRLISNSCLEIVIAGDGNIWLATVAGLSVVYINQPVFTIQNYSLPESMPGKTINSIAFWNGEVVVAALNGVFRFPQFSQPMDDTGETIITQVKINNIVYDGPKPELPYDQNNLIITYASSFINTRSAYLFRYRVLGLSPEWIETNTLEVPLLGMDPGVYTFEITAVNAHGHAGKIATFSFTIRAPWFRQWWFWLLMSLGILGSALYYYKLSRDKIILGKNLTLLRLRMLRAQMNPHFVFNALSNIQRLVQIQALKDAEGYIGTLASVMRKSIDYSGQEFIRLDDEINYTTQYLEIEKLRFGNKFDCAIEIKISEEERSSIYVPPLILQPLLENTIKHAFKGVDYKGLVQVTIEKPLDTMLRYTIKDNGSGFDIARMSHTQYGLGIIKERIELLYKNMDARGSFSIRSTREKPDNGTLVIIELPILKD